MKRLALVCALSTLSTSPLTALAASFEVNSGSTNTSPQTLANNGDTVTIDSGGALIVSDPANAGSVIAISITANGTIINNGIIQNTGGASGNNDRAIRDNTANTSLTIYNYAGASISAASDDAIQMNKPTNGVIVYNYGTITSGTPTLAGGQALDFNAITAKGSSTVYNYSTGVIQAYDADAVRPGVNGFVYNDGLIQAIYNNDGSKNSNDGIDMQENSGVTIVNATTGSSTVAGTGSIIGSRHGITGGAADASTPFTLSVTNNLGGLIEGMNGSGINIDGFNGLENVTITNYGRIIGNGMTADGDGVDVDGLVKITNGGTILSTQANGDTSEGITVGGGTITNLAGGLIEGDNVNGGIGVGITLAGVDKDSNGNAIPIQAIYANSTIDNAGTIRGQTSSAIQMTSPAATAYTVTINNQAGGLIEGGGASAAAISTLTTPTIITNAGIIQADQSGVAINFGGSSGSSLTVTGGSASIIGNVIGSTQGDTWVSITPGAGNTFSYAGNLSNLAATAASTGYGLYLGAGTTAFNGNLISGTSSIPTTVGVGSGGTLAISNGLTIHGSLTFNSGATYQISTDSAGTTVSNVHVSGAANLNGATLSLTGSGYTASRNYDILTADGGVNGTFGSVAYNTADYTFLMPSLSYGANDVNLNMIRNGTSFASVVAQGGVNQLAAARALDTLSPSSPLYGQVVALDGAQAASAFKALSGETLATTATWLQSVSAMAASLPLAHLQSNLGAGMLPGAPTAAAGNSDAATDASIMPRSAAYPAWVQVFGNWGSLGGSNDTSRTTASEGGLYLGADRDVGNGWRLGGALGYARSNLNAQGVTANNRIDSYSATLYGGKAFAAGPGAIKLSGGLAYTWHDVSSQRGVALGGLNQSLNANYNAGTSQIFGELGYALPLGGKTTIEPFAGVNWSDLRIDGFTESGGAAALTSQSRGSAQTTTTLGLHASTGFMLRDTQATLHATLGWRHAFGNVIPQATLAFQNSQAFTVSGAPIARNAAALELGARIAVTRNTTVDLSYNGQYGGGNRQNAGMLDIRTRF